MILSCHKKPTSPSIPSAKVIWEKTYGGDGNDIGFSVQETSDGGYIIAGYTTSFGAGYYDVYLMKTDADGESLWTRTYGGSDDDKGFSVQGTADGGYIIAGVTLSFGTGNYDVYLIKTDAFGNLIWEKTYGGENSDWGFSVQVTSDGGYIITGSTESSGAGAMDVYIVKTDANGDTLWTRTYGGIKNDSASSIQLTSDGGYIICGSSESFGAGKEDIYLLRIDSNGNALWTKTYGGTDYDYGSSVRQTLDGGYIIAGQTNSFGAGEYDVYLIKTDASGKILWTKTYGDIKWDNCSSIQETSDAGYIAVGLTDLSEDSHLHLNVYLIKTDASGNAIWQETYGGEDDAIGYSVLETSSGGYVVVGQKDGSDICEDIYLIKLK